MNVALIHDSLAELGGTERILQSLLRIYPDADVYTAYTTKAFYTKYYPLLSPYKIHSTWIEQLGLQEHASLQQMLAPLIWRSFSLKKYDLVISNNFHLMSNFVSVPNGVHIPYIQSPPKNIIGLTPTTPLQHVIPFTKPIRFLYTRALHQTPHILTGSKNIQQVLHEILGVHATVIHPPVNVPKTLPKRRRPQYYLCVSRLDPIKNFEIAIEACNRTRTPLKIVGISRVPAYEEYLKRIAGPTIEFLGYKNNHELASLYLHAHALIFPSLQEDFGIVPLEAMARGIPVIGYFGGGTKETIVEGVTGVFFRRHTPSALIDVMAHFNREKFDPHVLHHHASRFSEEIFRKKFTRYVESAIGNLYSRKATYI